MHTHTHSPENTMKLRQTHRHTQTFSLHNSSSFNLWQEIDGGKYQISCVRGQSCTPTPHLFSFFFPNTTTKTVYHMFSANGSLSSQFKKNYLISQWKWFHSFRESPSSHFHHLFIRALHIRCHLIWCCSVAGEQGQLSGACV